MKKIYLIVLGFIAMLAVNGQPMTGVWTKLANVDFPWFTSNNNVRSIAYNKVTDHVLASDMNNNVYILNAANGEQLGTLSRTGLGVEGFKHIRLRVADDGAIFGISLQLNANGICIVYRWANEVANPTIAAQFQVALRTGDALGISGSGANTIIYASGASTLNNNVLIYMLTTPNGTQFVSESVITIPSGNQQWANRTVEPVTNSRTSDLWLKTSSGVARRVTVGDNVGGVRTGTLAGTTPDDIPVGGFSALKHFVTSNGKKFLAFAASANATPANPQAAFMRIYDVSDESNVKLYGIDSLYDDPANSVLSNGNGTGDIGVKEEANGEFTIFWMCTNNGIKATKTGLELLPVSLAQFNASMRDQGAMLSWTTTSENNNSGFHIEKSVNGTDFASIGFVASKATGGNSNQAIQYEFNDNKLGEGKSYYRLKQEDKDGKSKLSAVRWVEKGFSNKFGARLRNNPVLNNLNLSVNSIAPANVQIVLTNATGARLQTTTHSVSAGENNIVIAASHLPKGIYYIMVGNNTDPSQKTTLKMIKN